MKKLLLWLAIGGVTYYAIEGVWRHFTCSDPPHIAMMIIGGLCFITVGCINQIPRFYAMPMCIQAFVGMLAVLLIEFASGIVVNVWLGWNLWDYSHLPLNLYGQVCLLYGGLWYLLMPFAIWLEDRLNWCGAIIAERHGKTQKYYLPIYDYSLREAYWWIIKHERTE